MIHKNAGDHYTHGHNKVYRRIDALKDSFNNGIIAIHRVTSRIEDTARKIDRGVKGAYSIYSTLEPFLGLGAETRGAIHGAKAAYNATSYAAREIYQNLVRELMPYVSIGIARYMAS